MKGLHFVRVRQPRGVHHWYVYAWRGGPLVNRRNSIRKPTFSRRELRNIEKSISDLKSPDEDTLACLISEWRWSASDGDGGSWTLLPPGVKRSWGRALDEIADKWGGSALSSWDDASHLSEICEWRDSSSGAREANAKVSALGALLEFGVSAGKLANNVAAGVKLEPLLEPRELRIWSHADMDLFASTALRRGKLEVLDGFRLAALTGLPRHQLLQLCWSDLESDPATSSSVALAKSTAAAANALENLFAELTRRYRAAGVETLLVDAKGESWTGSRFSQAFGRVRDAAASAVVLPASSRKNLHDLRTTFCAKLFDTTDLPDRSIAAAMRWRTAKVVALRHAWIASKLSRNSKG